MRSTYPASARITTKSPRRVPGAFGFLVLRYGLSFMLTLKVDLFMELQLKGNASEIPKFPRRKSGPRPKYCAAAERPRSIVRKV